MLSSQGGHWCAVCLHTDLVLLPFWFSSVLCAPVVQALTGARVPGNVMVRYSEFRAALCVWRWWLTACHYTMAAQAAVDWSPVSPTVDGAALFAATRRKVQVPSPQGAPEVVIWLCWPVRSRVDGQNGTLPRRFYGSLPNGSSRVVRVRAQQGWLLRRSTNLTCSAARGLCSHSTSPAPARGPGRSDVMHAGGSWV